MNGTVAPAPPSLPRWFWLLPLLALAAWWPIDPYWASDDFVALHYARDFGNVLRDFAGPQYGAQDLWLFYRPLIMLSFWLDGLVGGTDPWFAHFSNALAHAVNTLLVGLIWRRFLPAKAAFGAAVLWCMQPANAGAILWAIGRVDSHTTVWCLLSVWMQLRHIEGSDRARWLSVGAFALALLSKELAVTVPGLLIVITMLRTTGSMGSRLGGAVRSCAPHLLLLTAYFVFRRFVLGVFVGGYSAAVFDPLAMVAGLGRILLNLFDPGLATGLPDTGALPWWPWAGIAPALLALAVLLRRRQLQDLLTGGLVFLLASMPSAPFWTEPGNLHNLRYFYLPWVALAGLCAAAGRWTFLAALLVQLPVLVIIRSAYVTADRESAAMHAALLREPLLGTQDWFVAGMPHTNRRGTVMQLHFGVDRMVNPPWLQKVAVSSADPRLHALRPFAEVATVFKLDDEGRSFALPEGRTLYFATPNTLTPVPAGALPELPLEVVGGTDDANLAPMAAIDLRGDGLQRLKDGNDTKRPAAERLVIRLRTPGVAPPAYRITFFTATGYLSSVVPNHAPAGTPDGHVDLRCYLDKACCSLTPNYMLRALEIPAIHDLDPRFPVLVEAGSTNDGVFHEFRLVQGRFVPTHRARRMLSFFCDRQWPARVRAILGH